MSTFMCRHWIAWFRSVPVLCRNRLFVLVPVPLKYHKKRCTSMSVQAIMIIIVIMIRMLWTIMFVRTLINATATLPNQKKVYNIKNCTILLIFVSLSFRVYQLSESSKIVLVSGRPGPFRAEQISDWTALNI